MSPVPFRQQPAFRALFLGLILAATWIYGLFFQDGSRASLATMGLDLLLLFIGWELVSWELVTETV